MLKTRISKLLGIEFPIFSAPMGPDIAGPDRASRFEISVDEYLRMLKDAGVGSLPGTAAEILDQKMRDLIFSGEDQR